MTDDHVDAAVVEHIAVALEHSKKRLAEVQLEYNRLKAQVIAYENSLAQFRALDSGDFAGIVGDGDAGVMPVRHDASTLKHQIYEYFSARPLMTQSPSGLTAHFAEELGWRDKGLHVRVSNLLRKINREEDWLNKKGHGKYQFVAP